ncbi:MAG: hypothetical protein HQ582_33670, partial [Planctomycetes bacterium]|nr:hypothetical protein [Planctomycetota bacterium]
MQWKHRHRQATLSGHGRTASRLVGWAGWCILLPGLAVICSQVQPAGAEPVREAKTLLGSAEDYAYSWWMHGLRDERKVLAVRTSRFAMAMDVPKLKLTHLSFPNEPVSEAEALVEENAALFGRPNASLVCTVHSGDSTYRALGASHDPSDCHLVESGKFFHRREIHGLVWEPGAPELDGSLELAAWPDRLIFLLRLTPKRAINGGAIELELGADLALRAAVDPLQATLASDPARKRWTARLVVDDWAAGQEQTLALMVLTGSEPEPGEVQVTARQIVPMPRPLDVSYDRAFGWHQIRLRNDGNTAGYSQSSNDRIERVALAIENRSAHTRTVRLNFAKGLPGSGGVFGVTGLSAILRDQDGYPLGVPVQISKNWHTRKLGRYLGPWYRGLTMLRVPGETAVELEYTSVNALWGGVPAASHAQLSLVGWGNNQLWEQSAVGSWGESICYEPDQGQRGGAVLDTRPLMVYGMGSEPQRKWGWTCNVGGADFLVYYDAAGKKQWNSRMRTRRRRACPVLTEVTYAGESHDGKIGLKYTVSLCRTDDVTRGTYHFRYDVRQPVTFSRLVFFQCGGDDYSYTGEKKFAWGNENGCVREWETAWGGNRYKTEPVELTGRVPWVSMHEAVSRAEGAEAWANRGVILRQWDARLDGRPARPWMAERGAKVRGRDTSLLDLVPPPHIEKLRPGDYVEAVVAHVVVPQFADDYYGPNENLRNALRRDQNTWKMIYREALGSDLEVEVATGELARRSPTLIRAQRDRAEFSITGGLGYVPVTIARLS